MTTDLGSFKNIVSENISRDRGFRALTEASYSTLSKSELMLMLIFYPSFSMRKVDFLHTKETRFNEKYFLLLCAFDNLPHRYNKIYIFIQVNQYNSIRPGAIANIWL